MIYQAIVEEEAKFNRNEGKIKIDVPPISLNHIHWYKTGSDVEEYHTHVNCPLSESDCEEDATQIVKTSK